MTSPSKDTPAGDDEIKQTHADVTLYYFCSRARKPDEPAGSYFNHT